MDERAFLELTARRLGRSLGQAPAPYEAGVPGFHRGASPSARELAERFASELEKVGGKAYLEASPEAAAHRVRSLLEEWNPGRVVSWGKEAFTGWDLDWLWDRPGINVWDDPLPAGPQAKRAFLEADLGLTSADVGIAETGSLLLACGPTRPRSVSLAVPSHLALLRAERLVLRLGEAYAKFPPPLPSSLNLITGPSRTSDIENDATIGVHGPASLTVVIV